MKNKSKLNFTTKAFKAFVVLGFMVSALNTIAQPLTADAGPDQDICDGTGGVTIGGSPTATFGTPPYTYSWAPATGLSSTTVANPVTTINFNMTYTLTVTDAVAATATDAVYIGVTYQAIAYAGGDMTICAGSPVPTLSGSMGGSASSLTWTTSGTGTFSNPTSMVTTYTPSTADELAGSVVLTMTTNDPPGPCPAATSSLTLTINPVPVATISNGNMFCEGAPIAFSSATVSGGTYNWSGPNGFIASVQNPTIASSSTLNTGLYTLIVSIGSCSDTADINITVNPTPTVNVSATTNPSCNGFTDGTATATVVGGTAPYMYSWSPSSNTTAVATTLSAGTYTVYVTDANACTGQANTTLIDPSAITMSVFSPTICLGDSATLNPIVNGGVAPYTYVWDQGGTFYYTPSLTLAPTSGTTFTLSVTDANGCYTYDYPTITVNSLTDIIGAVSYSGGALSNGGTAVLFNYEFTAMTFDTVQTTPLDASGNYNFSSAPNGFYLIKIFGDTLMYPGVVPTYHTSEYLWNMATMVSHGCTSTTTANITMVEGVAGVGPGMISGSVFEGPDFQRIEGDPIPGIDIKLGRNPGGQLIASTTTNSTGAFSFTNLPINNPGEYYTVYVDIPGMDRDSTYNKAVTASDFVFTQLDHKVDSNSVYPIYPVTTSISNVNIAKQNKFNVYPNPFKENITVSYTLNANAEVKLDVYNVLGERVQSIVNTNQQAGEYTYGTMINFNAGIYFVSLRVNGVETTYKVVKLE
ncbi:MAG: T9SS type A sorting domain-containing protein [Bacteroidia bacterium]|nr:T9SS type A sorting domain-containing protein [Bacteroidia bacterium]